MEKALDIELPEREEFNTLSGLILNETEEIPKEGDQLRVPRRSAHSGAQGGGHAASKKPGFLLPTEPAEAD